MELVHDIFFFNSLMFNICKMLVIDITNMLGIVLKKIRTWTLMHSCKGPNHSFFDFVILFGGCCAWKWCMIYFFFDSLMFNLWKTCVPNIVNLLDIVLKNAEHGYLLSCKCPNHSFFDFVLLFWGGSPWKWCTIFFFWILWCPNNGKNGSWISLICWT